MRKILVLLNCWHIGAVEYGVEMQIVREKQSKEEIHTGANITDVPKKEPSKQVSSYTN